MKIEETKLVAEFPLRANETKEQVDGILSEYSGMVLAAYARDGAKFVSVGFSDPLDGNTFLCERLATEVRSTS